MITITKAGVVDLYIPRSGGGEGASYNRNTVFMSGYTSGFTDGYESGTTDGYESGYTSGYTDGAASLNLTSVTRNIWDNGTVNIAPPAGYNGLSSVTINTNVEIVNPLEPPDINWDYMWVKDVIGYPAVTFSANIELQIHTLNNGEDFDYNYDDWTTIFPGTTITVPLGGAVCFKKDDFESSAYITFSGKCSVGGSVRELNISNLNIKGDVVDASCVSLGYDSLRFTDCPELVLGPYAGLGYDISLSFDNTPKLSYLFLYDAWPDPEGLFHLSFTGTQNPFGICYHQAYLDHRWYYILWHPGTLPSGWREIKTL